MTTQHRNPHARNIYASLEHLNEVTGHRYAIRREGTNYILVSKFGEYNALPAQETVERLVTLRIAAQGRT